MTRKMSDEDTLNEEEDEENQQGFNDNLQITESSKYESISNTSSSTLSASSKFSGTGGKLAGWIYRTKKKHLKNAEESIINKEQMANLAMVSSSHSEDDDVQTHLPLLKEISPKKSVSKSKIPLHKTRLQLLHRSTDEESETLLATKSDRKPAWFFRKLKPRPAKISRSTENTSFESQELEESDHYPELILPDDQIKSNSALKTDNSNPPFDKYATEAKDPVQYSLKSCSSYTFPQINPPFFARSNPFLDPTLADALRDVVEMMSQLRESESHLTHIISKYIQDHGLEKELLNIMASHAKLHLDVERRAQGLTNEMWVQQAELMKTEETELKENLTLLVKENRQLQDDMDNLVKKNEKLTIRVNQCPDRRKLTDSGTQVLENLTRNNDKLRYKSSVLSAHIEEQEKESQRMQRKMQSLEQQIKNSNMQAQNYKGILQRMHTDHELEYSHLSHQLQLNQLTIKESVEAGDVLLEDLDGLKRQLKSMPCSLNWTKLKSRGNSLPDLIYMCRACINELSKELLNSQTEIILREKDNAALKEDIRRIEGNLQSSKAEQELLREQVLAFKTHEADMSQFNKRYDNLERDFSEYRQKMEAKVKDLEKERDSLTASIENVDSFKRKIIEKEEEVNLSQEKMCEYKSENDGLRMQLHGLKQVLTASGTGDVARELADIQEKLTFFQSQYYQLLSEKNYLIEQLQTANVERGALNDFQTSYYQFIQTQQQDLEVLNTEIAQLKQQLETERGYTSTLQLERNKLKEEKNVMKKIYHQLKNEINRVQQLEGEVVGMNMEANRLAIIAEYNKQLGEKLQCEVAERDVKISELQSNMEELNMAQIENVKDKVALCVELTEVCTMNDKLNFTLASEQQKSIHLDQTKKKLEDATNTQMKAVEEMQRAERAALKDLLKDYKNVVRQRDNLVASQTEYLQQISDLRTNAVVQTRNMECINMEHIHSLEHATSLETKVKELEDELLKVRGDVVKQENYNGRLVPEINQLKQQQETLEASIKYLQNTLQNLHNDLNVSRKNEVELKIMLEKRTQEIKDLQEELGQKKDTITEVTQENDDISEQLMDIDIKYKDLLRGYDEKVTDLADMNDDLQKSLEKAKILVQTRMHEIQRLENACIRKDVEIAEIQELNYRLVEQLKHLETSMDDIDLQSKLLSESNSQQACLQEALARLRLEHSQCVVTIGTLSKEKAHLQENLNEHVGELEIRCTHYRNYIEDLVKGYAVEKKSLEDNIQELSTKLQEANKVENPANVKLLDSHKELAAKLLKVVRILVREKFSRRGTGTSVSSLSEKNIRLASEKAIAGNTVALLLSEFTDIKTRFEDIVADKSSIQTILLDLQDIRSHTKSKFQMSEMEMRNIKRPSSLFTNTTLLTDNRERMDPVVEERIRQLKEDLESSHRKVIELTIENSNLKQDLTVLEFQKSEVVLRLHETQAKLKTEQNINKELIEGNQKVLSEVLVLENNGSITRPVSQALLQLVQGRGFETFELE